MNKEIQILKAAKELIIKPENWTKGSFARNKEKEFVNTNSTDAYSFCIMGSIRRAAFNLFNDQEKQYQYLYKAISAANDLSSSSVIDFNDKSEHKDVIAALDKTIAYLEKGIDQ